jgi:hypothetical protein
MPLHLSSELPRSTFCLSGNLLELRYFSMLNNSGALASFWKMDGQNHHQPEVPP